MGAINTYMYNIYLVFVWNFSKYPGDLVLKVSYSLSLLLFQSQRNSGVQVSYIKSCAEKVRKVEEGINARLFYSKTLKRANPIGASTYSLLKLVGKSDLVVEWFEMRSCSIIIPDTATPPMYSM